MAFNHENRKVYQRTLPFNVKVGFWTGEWDSRHAVCDQLPRAAGSMLENIAMASAAYSSREESAEYPKQGEGIDEARDKARDKDSGKDVLFHHETLDVYKVGIEAARAFCSSETASRLPNSVFRRLDELFTSLVLNIAEGNGRFSDADQARFLGTSHESAVKLAARLDLCVTQALLPAPEVVGWKALLERVSVMTASMVASLQR